MRSISMNIFRFLAILFNLSKKHRLEPLATLVVSDDLGAPSLMFIDVPLASNHTQSLVNI